MVKVKSTYSKDGRELPLVPRASASRAPLLLPSYFLLILKSVASHSSILLFNRYFLSTVIPDGRAISSSLLTCSVL